MAETPDASGMATRYDPASVEDTMRARWDAAGAFEAGGADDERAGGGVRGSRHIPIHEMADRIDEVPDGDVWVYCGSGYRASIAASMPAAGGDAPAKP